MGFAPAQTESALTEVSTQMTFSHTTKTMQPALSGTRFPRGRAKDRWLVSSVYG
jgi:hypothetical protein